MRRPISRRAAVLAAVLSSAAVVAAPSVAEAAPATRPAFRASCATAPVPSVVGLGELAAKMRLHRAGFGRVEVSVQKEAAYPVAVVTQLPAAGTLARRCDVVRIILGE